MKAWPYIIDTTLRDGEQAPGLAFSVNEKVIMAQMLDELGVDEVEAGTPAIGKNEQEAIKSIAAGGYNFVTSCWCRAKKEDIIEAAALHTQSINISLPASDIQIETLGKDRKWVINEIPAMVRLAKSLFPFVTIGTQDASRADDSFLDDFISIALLSGADRIRINDTVGILDPFETSGLFQRLNRKFQDTEFEFHGHNDLGMATANSFAALFSGARCVSGTINGIGERAGNMALEELIAGLKYKKNIQKYNTTVLGKLCRYIAIKSKHELTYNKPVVGRNAFRHESGIHTSALLRNPKTYQFLDPDDFGVERISLSYGKHSGTASVREFLRKEGLSTDDDLARDLLNGLKESSEKTGSSLSELQMKQMYQSMK